jgi:hypothetical protein
MPYTADQAKRQTTGPQERENQRSANERKVNGRPHGGQPFITEKENHMKNGQNFAPRCQRPFRSDVSSR